MLSGSHKETASYEMSKSILINKSRSPWKFLTTKITNYWIPPSQISDFCQSKSQIWNRCSASRAELFTRFRQRFFNFISILKFNEFSRELFSLSLIHFWAFYLKFYLIEKLWLKTLIFIEYLWIFVKKN